MSFGPGELEKAVSVPILDDGIPGASRTFVLSLTSPTGNADLGSQTTTSVTILNTDVPTPVDLSPVVLVVTESARLLTFTVSRTSSGTIGTVDFTTTPGTATAGSDYITSHGTLSFGVNDVSKVFTVPVLDDSIYEPDETFSVALSNATSGLTLGAATSATVTIHDGDTDGDGLPDDYETMHGFDPGVASDAALDSDGDGFTNLQEFTLGTDPRNPASALRPSLSLSGSDVQIDFLSMVGRTYTVESSGTLQSPWSTVQNGIPGTGGNITITHTGGAAASRRFYRIKATAP